MLKQIIIVNKKKPMIKEFLNVNYFRKKIETFGKINTRNLNI
jgi:hypothetical protein